MDNFREFQGADLDECIQQAMEWFSSKREMLEVEIIQDAKSGIFGIVGARKAKIRARKAQMAEKMRDLLGSTKTGEKPAASENAGSVPAIALSGQDSQAKSEDTHKDIHKECKKPVKSLSQTEERLARKGNRGLASNSLPKCDEAGQARDGHAHARRSRAGKPERFNGVHDISQGSRRAEAAFASMEEDADIVVWPVIPVSELDQEKLKARTLEVVRNLIAPLTDKEPGMELDLSQGYPRVRIAWEGDAGILIGRDGHTLVAVQYLASRILSRIMGSSLRVRLDIGDYRAKQIERLKELALALADKARHTGKSYSTRPLTSYHRRVIHIALHEAADIQTRSAGDGSLKRVIIAPRRV